MKNFLRTLSASLAALVIPFTAHCQVNTNVTEKTKVLYENLKIIQNSNQFLFGQEFFNSFKYSSGGAHGDKDVSDSKSVTGSHPALLGSDFHYYLEKDATERGYHTEAVKWAYQQGCVITFDWHISGRNSATYEYNVTNKDLVNNIVNNLNGDRDWLYQQFDKVIDIINNDLVVDNERIPIVFRPWHEMNGGWFWWGSQATTSANYKTLYQLTVDYFKERTTSVLFCWSPNSPVNMNYFPGNNCVDVLGVDIYEATSTSLRSNLATIVDYAQTNGKVAVLSETGNRTANGEDASGYWKNTILPGIMEDPTGKSKKIAWVLTWINSSWSYPYVPHGASSSAAKQSFVSFKDSQNVLFVDEIQNMYAPIEVPVGSEPESNSGFEIFPVPSKGSIKIRLKDFSLPAKAVLYNLHGEVLEQFPLLTSEVLVERNRFNTSGVYIISVSDGVKTQVQKVIIE